MLAERKKKIILQIIVIIGIALFFHFFIDSQIYRPIVKENHNFLESDESVAIYSISLWVFASSIAYWIYPQRLLTNFIVAPLPIITFIMIFNIYHNFYLDFLHWVPFILGHIILIKYRNHLDKKLLLFTFICLIWGLIACIFTPNYSVVDPLSNGIWIGVIWILSSYLLIKMNSIIDKKFGKIQSLIKKPIY